MSSFIHPSIQPASHLCTYPPTYLFIFHLFSYSSILSIYHSIPSSIQLCISPSINYPCMCSSMHTSIYPLIYSPSLIHPAAIHPSMLYLCIHLYDYALSTHLAMHAPTGLSIHYQLVRSCIHLSTHSSFHPLICPSTCLCIIIHPSFQSFFQPANHAVFFFFCSEFA